MSESVPLPFDDLRRLTGPNLYFAGPGAVLETRVGAPVPTALIEDWKRRIARARAALGWPDGPVTVREHASGASLAFAAPGDMLYTAADVNEWAWLSALAAAGRGIGEPALQPGHPSFVDEDADLRLLRVVAAAEGLPRLPALQEAARAHGLPAYVIFHDATLAEMARERPESLDALAGISGVGAKKLEAYGQEILRVVGAVAPR